MTVNLKKLLTDFFIRMALTTNISFIVSPNTVELVIVVAMNLAATILKIRESRMLSAEQMAASLAADLHLVPALFFYAMGDVAEGIGLAWGRACGERGLGGAGDRGRGARHPDRA